MVELLFVRGITIAFSCLNENLLAPVQTKFNIEGMIMKLDKAFSLVFYPFLVLTVLKTQQLFTTD